MQLWSSRKIKYNLRIDTAVCFFPPSSIYRMVASTNTARKFILASRQSQLAQAQTVTVLQGLQKAHPDVSFDTQFMSTAGDNNQSQALYLLGGKALWTKELEVALKDKSVDFLIHSFKDVPTVLPGGCEIAAILEREDPVDSLVMKSGSKHKSLDDLPPGSVIGTSSVRRVAQLKRNYPHLEFLSVVRIHCSTARYH